MGGVTRFWYVNFLAHTSLVADGTMEENEQDSSGEEDMSVEIVSPPRPAGPTCRQHITRSVTAKRVADEMELEGDSDALLISSPPRPRKIRRVTGELGMFAHCLQRPATKVPTGSPINGSLFTQPQTPEPIGMDSTYGTGASRSQSSHLGKDYFESENPWEDIITYF